MNLYEITGNLLQLQLMLESGDYDEEALHDTIESIDAIFEDKADGYAKVIRNMESDIEAIKAEQQRLSDRKKVLENGIQRLKDNLEQSMIALDKRKFKTQLFSFTIQKNPAKVIIDDDEAVPDAYLVPQPPKLDKKALADALKAGELTEGIAHLEQSESLRIR